MITAAKLTSVIGLAGGMILPLCGQASNVSKPQASCTSSFTLAAPITVDKEFNPSGWLGDGAEEKGKQYVQMFSVASEKPRPGDDNNLVTKVHYRPGSIGWAGVYFLWPANNWGDKPIKKITGASKISFWAAGQKGTEIVEFKAGGITGKACQDSFEVSLGQIALSKEWKRYEISLRNHSPLSVVGAFAWVATGDANPGGLTFYIDDIRYDPARD
jgi:hypothetical protein